MHRAGLVTLAILLVSPSSFADETETFREQVKLIYRVPPGCPDESAFVAVVTARTQRAEFVEHDSTSRRFVVDIRRRGKAYDGRLVIEEPAAEGSDRAAVRELTGARCVDLVRAFALFTAIAIDPGTDPSVRGAPPRAPAPASSSGSVSPPRSPPALLETRRSPALVRSTAKPTQARVWHGAWGSGVFVVGGVARSMMVSAHPVVELASSGPLLSPSVSVGLVWANGASEPAGTAEIAFGLRVLVLSGCAVRVAMGTVGLRLCAALEGGVLTAQPFGIERPRSLVNPWFAADLLVRLDVPILPSRLSLEVEAGVAVPFTRLRGFVDPGPIVANVEGLGPRFGAAFLVQAF